VTGRVVSLQVGKLATLPFRGRDIPTGIFKTPVEGPVSLGDEGFEGDVQADRRHHGGPENAVCVHPTEHWPDWEALVGQPLPYGAFGENLSTSGLLETGVHIGDVFTLGSATVQVSQPRSPCYKLATRWRKRKLVAAMAEEGRSGWYFRVLQRGEVQAGDELVLTDRVSDVSVREVMRIMFVDREDHDARRRAAELDTLAPVWRDALAG
jgi:MOSC domain-containing protein YiiM